MKKLTFERAVLIVFILIILISTSDTTLKFIETRVKRFDAPMTSTTPAPNPEFPARLTNAENLYKLGDYEGAINEYFAITLTSTLAMEQKAHAYFRLGVCHYNLKNYDMAVDSFETVVSFSTNDSVAYNNAAVSAYKANDLTKAIELQQKALDIVRAVEYYYNLARMYEEIEAYDKAVGNYLLVAKGEHNISKIDRIDPVRVKEKVARLMPNNFNSIGDNANNVLIALKLKDEREILTLDDNEMLLKSGDFVVEVENVKTTKNIIAAYNKEEYDPYNLISELVWTIYKDGKQLYKKNGDKIVAAAKVGGNYDVRLSIKYNGNQEMMTTKTVRIQENQTTIDIATKDEVIVKPPSLEDLKTYPFALYEQLFEGDFKISSSGYTDRYSVMWGKDSGVETSINKKLAMDKSSSLVINNNSGKDAGLWINLDSLLKEGKIKGKQLRLSFYARKVSENTNLEISIRVKTEDTIGTTTLPVQLPYQFEQKSISVYIPENASGVTMSIKASPESEFNMDGFIITD